VAQDRFSYTYTPPPICHILATPKKKRDGDRPIAVAPATISPRHRTRKQEMPPPSGVTTEALAVANTSYRWDAATQALDTLPIIGAALVSPAPKIRPQRKEKNHRTRPWLTIAPHQKTAHNSPPKARHTPTGYLVGCRRADMPADHAHRLRSAYDRAQMPHHGGACTAAPISSRSGAFRTPLCPHRPTAHHIGYRLPNHASIALRAVSHVNGAPRPSDGQLTGGFGAVTIHCPRTPPTTSRCCKRQDGASVATHRVTPCPRIPRSTGR